MIAACAWLPTAQAQTPVAVQNEVNYLLGYVAGSGCEFYRNGTWYSAQRAQAHLRDKFRYLQDNNLSDTTEHFIERAAAQSSLSGTPYQIRCAGAAPVASQQWLREQLAVLRAAR
jgi:hypothetical protein